MFNTIKSGVLNFLFEPEHIVDRDRLLVITYLDKNMYM